MIAQRFNSTVLRVLLFTFVVVACAQPAAPGAAPAAGESSAAATVGDNATAAVAILVIDDFALTSSVQAATRAAAGQLDVYVTGNKAVQNRPVGSENCLAAPDGQVYFAARGAGEGEGSLPHGWLVYDQLRHSMLDRGGNQLFFRKGLDPWLPGVELWEINGYGTILLVAVDSDGFTTSVIADRIGTTINALETESGLAIEGGQVQATSFVLNMSFAIVPCGLDSNTEALLLEEYKNLLENRDVTDLHNQLDTLANDLSIPDVALLHEFLDSRWFAWVKPRLTYLASHYGVSEQEVVDRLSKDLRATKERFDNWVDSGGISEEAAQQIQAILGNKTNQEFESFIRGDLVTAGLLSQETAQDILSTTVPEERATKLQTQLTELDLSPAQALLYSPAYARYNLLRAYSPFDSRVALEGFLAQDAVGGLLAEYKNNDARTVVSVAAAGNFGAYGYSYPFAPALWESVIGVSATQGPNWDLPMETYSNPGEIRMNGTQYTDTVRGTSFAAPKLSLEVALYLVQGFSAECLAYAPETGPFENREPANCN